MCGLHACVCMPTCSYICAYICVGRRFVRLPLPGDLWWKEENKEEEEENIVEDSVQEDQWQSQPSHSADDDNGNSSGGKCHGGQCGINHLSLISMSHLTDSSVMLIFLVCDLFWFYHYQLGDRNPPLVPLCVELSVALPFSILNGQMRSNFSVNKWSHYPAALFAVHDL